MSKADIPSYHDLHITTRKIPRTSIFNLPFGVSVECTRVGGWQVWRRNAQDKTEELLGGEYECGPDAPDGDWLVLDIAGYVICDSRPEEPKP